MTIGNPATRETWRKLQDMYTWYKRVLRNPETPPEPSLYTSHGKLPAPTLAIAHENIDHNSIGKVKLSEILGTPATTGATTPPTAIAPNQLRDVRNFVLPRIWAGATCLIEYCTVQQSGGIWVVTKAWSALRLRGQLTAALSGSSGSMDNLIQLDGYYPVTDATTTVTFQNALSDTALDNAVGVVGWNDADKQWELDEVVCS